MKVNNKLIQDISNLSKLKFNASEQEQMKADLKKILDFVDKLNEIETDGIDPLIYMNDEVNVLRKDISSKNSSKEDALKNAPEKDSDYFKVPTVLKK
tara:strand:+ start:2985 stop:3275 length:291 start_codon:yes stop_codon:yes gene_type:complete